MFVWPGYGASDPAQMRTFKRTVARVERRGWYRGLGSRTYVARQLLRMLWLPREPRRIVSQRTGKGYLRQLVECALLMARFRLEPVIYYESCLYEPGRFARAGEFVGPRQQAKILNHLNRRLDCRVLEDKLMFASHCKAHGICSPEVLYAWTPDDDAPFGLDGAASAAARTTGLFVKPRFGIKGVGMAVARLTASGTWSLRRGDTSVERLSAQDLATALTKPSTALIVQPCLANHPDLHQSAGAAIATVRLVTLRVRGEVTPLLAAMRFGGAGGIVDNISQGGHVAPIDLDTGRLGPASTTNPAIPPRSVRRTPAAQRDLSDIVVPHFTDAIQTGLALHRSVPDFLSLGTDIAITAEAPLVLESNPVWSARSVQMPHDLGLGATRYVSAILATLNDDPPEMS